MSLDKETVLKIEEFKEVGHEQRYREQLMVQEFSLSLIATGVIVGVILPRPSTLFALVVQCFGLAFLMLLTLHLRNMNQDRLAALLQKEELRNELGFKPIHQNVADRKRRFISISAPRAIVWFAASMTVTWFVWIIIEVISMVYRKQ